MATSAFSVFLSLFLFFWGLTVYGNDQEAVTTVSTALSKLKACPTYRLTHSLQANLAPGSSGAMVPVQIEETAVLLVVRTGSVVRAHESKTVRENISPFRFLSRGTKETRTTVWDGSWIYSWGESGTGTKMVDNAVNRSAAIIENLYGALLTDDSLRLGKEETVSGHHCFFLESSAEILTPFLYIPGKVAILIDKETGFPVRISVQNEKSKATVNYTAVDTNPTYQVQLFTPPSKVSFDTIRGQEDIPNGSPTNTVPVSSKPME